MALDNDNKRDIFVTNYLLLSQVLFFLLLGILVFRSSAYTYEEAFFKLPTLIVFILLLSLTPLLQLLKTKNKNQAITIDLIIILFYLIVATILLINEEVSLFKMILLMPVVITAIKYGIKMALGAAVLSIMALFIICSFNNFASIDSAIMLSGIFLLFAWLLGNMTETERAIRTELANDIEERKKVEKMLRETEERYRKQVELSPDGIILCNNGKIFYGNNKAANLFGFSSPTQLVGKLLLDFIQPEFKNITKKWLKQVVAGEQTKPYLSAKGIKSDSSEIDLEAEAIAFSYQGHQICQLILRDTTERKKLEEELVKASKLESIGILAGGIAHDFNNLLTIIMGNVSLARMKISDTEKSKKFLSEIEKASKQAKDLTQQLLTFAKGGMPPVTRVISAKELLSETVNLILSGSNVKCDFTFAADLEQVKVDEGQLKQVINNLIINATQAMPDGGTIWVKAHNLIFQQNELNDANGLATGNYVAISIRDEGIGIPPENLHNIFDPYFTTKDYGTGLGLATCYSIIKNHKGSITVSSKVGQGTTFTILLPASLEKLQLKNEEEYSSDNSSKGKILVMDDEEAIRATTVTMLEDLGYIAFPTSEGVEAINQYQQALNTEHPFDAVIMDLTIPGGMGGRKTIEKLLEIDPNVKAIVSSGYSNDQVIANFHDYGFSGFLPKPYAVEDLCKALQQLLNSKSSRQLEKLR